MILDTKKKIVRSEKIKNRSTTIVLLKSGFFTLIISIFALACGLIVCFRFGAQNIEGRVVEALKEANIPSNIITMVLNKNDITREQRGQLSEFQNTYLIAVERSIQRGDIKKEIANEKYSTGSVVIITLAFIGIIFSIIMIKLGLKRLKLCR